MGSVIIGYEIVRHGHAFAVMAQSNGRWQAFIDGDGVGSYHRPEAAIDDLRGGHTFTPASGIDSAEFHLPESLREWTPVIRAPR